MKRLVTVGALVALLVPGNAAVAQFSAGARSVGMGGGGMVFATGVDAVELNPANLAWAGGWNLSIGEAGVSFLSTGIDVAEILAIFDPEANFLGSLELDVAQVINGLPDEGVGFSQVSEGFLTAYGAELADLPRPGSPLPSMGLSIGSFGLRVRSRVFMEGTLSKELADLIGNGFSRQRIQEYAVGETGFRSVSVSEITASYGLTLGGLLSIGVGARYVIGHSLTDGRFFEPELDLISVPSTLSITTVAVEATSGTGYGLDVGLSLDLPGGLRASVSGTNVMQRMTWDDQLTAHTATYTDTDFDNSDPVDLVNMYTSEQVSSSSASLPVFLAAENLFEQSYFPAIFRGGLGLQVGGTSLELVGIKVSPRGRQRTAWDERVSLGIEQKIPILTLRAGIARAQDGVQALTGGVGLRLGPVHLDASGGIFNGENAVVNYDGGYVTVSLQIKGGGA